ncbi:hypothetical protein K4K54_006390 [Colletotrichum sp. SAR 10_86]|nr:hypothetical protein K4K54_006390 [Colletotrichum sp. SAR 10_86]
MPPDNVEKKFKASSAGQLVDQWKRSNKSLTFDGVTKNYTLCTMEFFLPEELQPPVLYYYRLTNFHQNHREYVNSRDKKQLMGDSVSINAIKSSDCGPLKTRQIEDGSEEIIFPCGMIANSYFNDTFHDPIRLPSSSGSNQTHTYNMSRTGIAKDIDRAIYRSSSYQIPAEAGGNDTVIVPPPGWVERFPNGYHAGNMFNPAEDESFMVWMRTSAGNRFTKLAMRNNDDAMERGMYRIEVISHFPIHKNYGTNVRRSNRVSAVQENPNNVFDFGKSYRIAMDIVHHDVGQAPPPVAKGRIYATTEELWTCHQGVITRLYKDENRPLKEVKQIMETEYFFHATERMYKTRIKRWGLDKKFKEAEILALLKLKRDRDAVGKNTRFAIRNQDVDWGRVVHYLKRRPDLQDTLRLSAAAGSDKSVVQWDRVVQYLSERPDLRADLEAVAGLDVVCRTPSPVPEPLDPAPGLRFTDEILRILGGFFDGVFQDSVWSVVDGALCTRGRRPSRKRLNKWCGVMGGVYELLGRGETEAATTILKNEYNFIKWIVQNSDPELTYFLCYNVLQQPPQVSDVLVPYAYGMYATVLGERHPLTLIWRRIRAAGVADRVGILSAMVRYTSLYLQTRLDVLNVTMNWIHGLQGQLLEALGETGGNDFQRIVSMYTRAAREYADVGRLKDECKCLFALVGLHSTAKRYDLAMQTLGRAHGVVEEVRRSHPAAEQLMQMWTYGEMGQLSYSVMSAGRYKKKKNYAREHAYAMERYGENSKEALSHMLEVFSALPCRL